MKAIKLALAAGLLLAVTNAGWAQSAYTTGTVDSSERAGYPAPYGPAPFGGGQSLYAFAPGDGYSHAPAHRSIRHGYLRNER